MTVKPRRPMGGRPEPQRSAEDLVTAKKPAGRPKGEPSTIVNVRLPLTLVAELDRYLDRLEEPDRPQGQPRHDRTAGLRALFGVACLRGCYGEKGVGGSIVAENRDCRE